MFEKRFVLLGILSILALLVVACAPAATPQVVRETVVVEVPAEAPVVRLSGWTSSPAEDNLVRQILLDCGVSNPDVRVKYEPIPANYGQVIRTEVAAGTEPDIYYMDIFEFPFFAGEGVLQPLDDYMAEQGISRDDFIASLINAFTFDGQTYGIPKDFNTLALF